MTEGALAIFVAAAVPQKLVFVALAASIPLGFVLAARGLRRGAPPQVWLSALTIGAPAIALATAALNAWHMMATVLRLPQTPTPAMLAPGLAEIALLACLGAAAGLAAVTAHGFVQARARAALPA